MLLKNFKEKNKNYVCSELPKIALLPKKMQLGPLGVNILFLLISYLKT